MEKELLRLMLQYSFWNTNRHKILREFFPNNLQGIYELIGEMQEKYKKDLHIGEVKALYKTNNPNMTKAQWELIEQVLDNIPNEIGEDVAKEILQKAYITEMGRRIAQIGIDTINGQPLDLTKIREIVEKTEQGELSEGDDLQAVSSELEDILGALETTTKWNYYLQSLHKVCPGMGDGIFTIVAGRPEQGKSLYGISMCAAPGGFAEQGAKVYYYANEEAAIRLQGRAIMSYTGMPLQEMMLNPDRAKKLYRAIAPQLKFFNCRDKSISDINYHINRHKPDICVIDQLDKLQINGSFSRDDERLGALYTETRNIAARHSCAIMALTQLHADSEGKTYISSANLAGARTAKAAEGDVVIGIGKMPGHEENSRVLNFIKNKINSNHSDVICMMRPEISRYVD